MWPWLRMLRWILCVEKDWEPFNGMLMLSNRIFSFKPISGGEEQTCNTSWTHTHTPQKKIICHFVSSLTVNVAHYMTATTYNNHKPTSTYTHPRTLTLIRSIKSITTTPSNHLTKLTAVKHFIIRWDIAAEGESECARARACVCVCVFRWEFSRF